MSQTCENIKSQLEEMLGKGLSDKAKLVALLEACGVSDREEVERLLECKQSTLREARRALKIQRQKSSGDGNPAPEIQRSAGNPAQTPEIQRQKSSDPSCAGATKESLRDTITVVKAQLSYAESKLDLNDLSNQLFDAAGSCLANQAIAPGLAMMTIPQMWIEHGADLERDVLPSVRMIAAKYPGKQIKSWDYFTAAVAETKAKRLAGLPAVTATGPQQFHQTFHGSVKAMLAEMGVE